MTNVSPVKVLHLITQLELGGAQRSTLELLARLNRRLFAPTLLSSDGRLSQRARHIEHLPLQLWPTLRRDVNPLADSWTLTRLAAFMRRGGYAIVHTHSSKAGILGRWAAHVANVPVIVHTIHGFGFHAFQPSWVRRTFQWIERKTARISDGLITVSERDRRTALALGIGAASRHRLIRYGLEPERAHPSGVDKPILRGALGLHPHRPIIGTISCLKPQKAPLDFVRACARIAHSIPEAQFLLIGDGVLRRPVEQLRDRLGLTRSLHLLGWREDIPELLSLMDLFVLTSRWEGLPIVCLEAMAAGLPIVATAAGGTPELVDHGRTGRLVPIGQPDRLAEEAIALLGHPHLMHRMGCAARLGVVGEYTLDRMVSQTEQFYVQLLQAAGCDVDRLAHSLREERSALDNPTAAQCEESMVATDGAAVECNGSW